MNVGSLFSGIGGFELGFEREGFRTKWFIENSEYCQVVLRKNFPNIPIYADIRETDFRKLEWVNILTGGFPCQDISCANPRGEGITGERSGLWSYYAKAIREIRPEYAVIENVPMLASRGLNVVLGNLAENGYDAEWFCLRASDFGALHRRERLFVIAYPNSKSPAFQKYRDSGQERQPARTPQPEMVRQEYGAIDTEGDRPRTATNPNHQWQSQLQRGKQDIRERVDNSIETPCFITNDFSNRIQRFTEESLQGEQGFSWCADVRRIEDLQGRPSIPQPLFRGGRDGIPNWMGRIKCCGNAVVPQVAQFIARRIKEIEGVLS